MQIGLMVSPFYHLYITMFIEIQKVKNDLKQKKTQHDDYHAFIINTNYVEKIPFLLIDNVTVYRNCKQINFIKTNKLIRIYV
jgi:hypothetical protein